MTTPLGNAITFLKDFGFFDVVLPFLLVFTLVFAILEKTRLFGIEKIKGDEYPRRNINSMVAFSIAFFVIAASNIVETIQGFIPQISLVLVLLISTMLLAGVFMGDKQFNLEEHAGIKYFLIFVILIVSILIFFNYIEWDSNETVLEHILDYTELNWETGPVVSGVVFLAVLIFIIWYIVGFTKPKGG